MPETTTSTGMAGKVTSIVEVPFDRYVITVRLGAKDEFLEVVEVKASKNFLTQQQKIATSGYHDVSDLYPE